MADIGPRPGSGRKSEYRYIVDGVKYRNLREAVKACGVVDSTIKRWCSGGKPNCYKEKIKDIDRVPSKKEVEAHAVLENLTPLEYMLKIMNNPIEDPERRDKMANWAAKYVHPVGSDKKGKKEEQEDRAKKAAKGRFSAGKPPLSLVKGTK